MKFTHTDNQSYRVGIGYVPRSWIDYGKDHMDSILQYLWDHVKVFDADMCGDTTVDFVFEDGKAYRLEYSWWIDNYQTLDEYGEGSWIGDDWEIEEISIDDAHVPEKQIGRDWI